MHTLLARGSVWTAYGQSQALHHVQQQGGRVLARARATVHYAAADGWCSVRVCRHAVRQPIPPRPARRCYCCSCCCSSAWPTGTMTCAAAAHTAAALRATPTCWALPRPLSAQSSSVRQTGPQAASCVSGAHGSRHRTTAPMPGLRPLLSVPPLTPGLSTPAPLQKQRAKAATHTWRIRVGPYTQRDAGCSTRQPTLPLGRSAKRAWLLRPPQQRQSTAPAKASAATRTARSLDASCLQAVRRSPSVRSTTAAPTAPGRRGAVRSTSRRKRLPTVYQMFNCVTFVHC